MSRKDISNIKLATKNNKEESKSFRHENFVAGIAPNLRGIYSTMYVRKPLKVNQNAGFSTVEEGNFFYRKNLDFGQREFSVTFDLATQLGYDSDDKRAQGNVGKSGIAIDSVEDMKILFDHIPLDEVFVTMAMNPAILPVLAFYIVVAEEQGISTKSLKGAIQNDIFKELVVNNTDVYPLVPSMKIIEDIFRYANDNMPKFNSIAISGYYMQEIGATLEIELAYSLTQGLEHVRKAIAEGIDIDTFAPRLSFSWGTGMDHFKEIAKMRAGRMLWAKLMKEFNPKNPKSLSLRAHCQTSSWSLTAQDPFNNITRTTIEAMAAVFGGTQSLQANVLDEVISLPTDISARIARNTQIYLQEETNITKTVDPWAGSYYLEELTEKITNDAWELIEEIEELGGMAKAIEKGIPKMRIEEAKKDSDKDVIIGVNKYQLKKEDPLPIIRVDKKTVRSSQITKLKKLKEERNRQDVEKSLNELTNSAKKNKGNLLNLAIKAAKNRATLGEITNALETVFGKH